MRQKDWLKLHLQEFTTNQGFNNSIIDNLVDCKFEYPCSLLELRHFINKMNGVSRLIFYGDSSVAINLGSWVDFIDRKELHFKIQFDVNPLFGLKVYLTINRSVQLFLQSCQDANDVNNTNFLYLNFTFTKTGKLDGYINNLIPVILHSGDNTKRTVNVVLLTMHILERLTDPKAPIPRDDLISFTKLFGEGAMEEIKMITGCKIGSRRFIVQLIHNKTSTWSSIILNVLKLGCTNHDKIETLEGFLNHSRFIIALTNVFPSQNASSRSPLQVFPS